MDRILDLAHRLARYGAWAGGALVILAVAGLVYSMLRKA